MGVEIACSYTLSTISQTLAVAFGFLLAVVVYRMQAIGNGLQRNPAGTGALLTRRAGARARMRGIPRRDIA